MFNFCVELYVGQCLTGPYCVIVVYLIQQCCVYVGVPQGFFPREVEEQKKWVAPSKSDSTPLSVGFLPPRVNAFVPSDTKVRDSQYDHLQPDSFTPALQDHCTHHSLHADVITVFSLYLCLHLMLCLHLLSTLTSAAVLLRLPPVLLLRRLGPLRILLMILA